MSVYLFMCRRMGVHVTFVRSCDLDEFNPEQLSRMTLGGNGVARQFFINHGVSETQMLVLFVELNRSVFRYFIVQILFFADLCY